MARTPFSLVVMAVLLAAFVFQVLYQLGWSIEQIAGLCPWRCPLNYFTGMDCPTCGLGRSLVALILGKFSLSLEYNPLGILLALTFGLYLPFDMMRRVRYQSK